MAYSSRRDNVVEWLMMEKEAFGPLALAAAHPWITAGLATAGAYALPYAGSAYNWGKKKLTNEEEVDYDEAPEGVDNPEPETVNQRYKNWVSGGVGKQDLDDFVNNRTDKATKQHTDQQAVNYAAAREFLKKPWNGTTEDRYAKAHKIETGGQDIYDSDNTQEMSNYIYGRPAREGRDATIASKVNAVRDRAANEHYKQYAHGPKDPEDYEADVEQYGDSTIKNLPVKGILR